MGKPEAGPDLVDREITAIRRRWRRRRFRRRMLWLLTCATTMALVVIAVLVRDIAREPVAAGPATLSAKTGHLTGRPAASATARASSKSEPLPVAAAPQVTDTTSGLVYELLAAPWQRGCPATLNNAMFSWTAGENTVAGLVDLGGSRVPWHGLACSGDLQQQFSYGGPADLAATATSLVGALDPAYYAGVQHDVSMQPGSALLVSGHQAWQVTFTVRYFDGASQGLTWSSELGAVVVVDRGPGQEPAVFYVSVPSNLGTDKVSALIGSLQLS